MAKRDGLHDFLFRIPEELWVELVKLAEADDRTVTQMLVRIIREFVERKKQEEQEEQRKAKKGRGK